MPVCTVCMSAVLCVCACVCAGVQSSMANGKYKMVCCVIIVSVRAHPNRSTWCLESTRPRLKLVGCVRKHCADLKSYGKTTFRNAGVKRLELTSRRIVGR